MGEEADSRDDDSKLAGPIRQKDCWKRKAAVRAEVARPCHGSCLTLAVGAEAVVAGSYDSAAAVVVEEEVREYTEILNRSW